MDEENNIKTNEKQEKLKQIIKQLHKGVPVDRLKKDFEGNVKC